MLRRTAMRVGGGVQVFPLPSLAKQLLVYFFKIRHKRLTYSTSTKKGEW